MFTVEVNGEVIAEKSTALEARKAARAWILENWKPVQVKKDGKLTNVFKPVIKEFTK